MLARRLDPPLEARPPAPTARAPSAAQRAEGRWRARGQQPTRGPAGEVEWWARPAPRADERLWDAVRRLHARRIVLDRSVSGLARQLGCLGHPIRRETLSRVLNGKQATSWTTVELLADALGVDIDVGDA